MGSRGSKRVVADTFAEKIQETYEKLHGKVFPRNTFTDVANIFWSQDISSYDMLRMADNSGLKSASLSNASMGQKSIIRVISEQARLRAGIEDTKEKTRAQYVDILNVSKSVGAASTVKLCHRGKSLMV